MAWRFADLPVRTKFLITLGIPVLGMVLLISKQVDSSIKRRNVLQYIRGQSHNIELLGQLMHETQKESGLSIAYLTGLEPLAARLTVQQNITDDAIRALRTPAVEKDGEVLDMGAFKGLEVLRQRIVQQRISAAEAERSFRQIKSGLLDDMGRVAKLALDPETKDKLYSLISLVYAKDALGTIRSMVTRALATGVFGTDEMAALDAQVAQYETSLLLFERDAPPEAGEAYRSTFQGPSVNLLRSLMGTIHERGSLQAAGLQPAEWWALSSDAVEKLKTMQDLSIALIGEATASNLREAETRLLMVLVALAGVLGAVAVMAFLITRGIRETVQEVSTAAVSLAEGDVSAHVPVRSSDEIGRMARSFNGMMDNIRALAANAEAIGRGNYDTPVKVRGDRDILGMALSRMKENLKAARLRDLEQNRALQEEKEKLEQANERIHVLIREIHHRVKNNLQVIASLLRLQSATIDDEKLQHVFDQSQSRVASMALIHEKLYKGDDLAQLDVALYLRELFSELIHLNKVRDTIHHRTTIDPGLTLDLNTMVPLGLILNELITNSFKHAFQGREDGNIDLKIHHVGSDEYDLIYQDDGIGIPEGRMHTEGTTLGVSLIESLVEQLNGFITVDTGPTGTVYHIRFRTER